MKFNLETPYPGLFCLAGPCMLESEKLALTVAFGLREIEDLTGIPMIFKGSFDKANRTSLGSPRGPGLAEGLRILSTVRKETGLPVTTDVHETAQIGAVAEVADCIQIPAFLSRQTDLLVEAGRTGKWVNLKKGQFLSPDACLRQVEKIVHGGSSKVTITERGSMFGYERLIVDFAGFAQFVAAGVPVVFDSTHTLQRPPAGADTTGADTSGRDVLGRAAIAAGARGIFAEVHPDPSAALSDKESQIPLDRFVDFLRPLAEIFAVPAVRR